MVLTKATYSMIKGAPVNVIDYISGGTGTNADPYVGWDTAITWAEDTEYVFPAGVFRYATTLNWAKNRISLRGSGSSTVLKFTGTGNCISFDGGITGVNAPRIRGFLIEGNASATNAIYTNNTHWGVCQDVTVKNVSVAGFRSIFGVYWRIEDFYISDNFGVQTTHPAAGIFLGDTGIADTVTAYTIINANISNCVNSGIDIRRGWQNTIIGGAVESNGDQGLYIGEFAHDNLINGLYVEANTTYNIRIAGVGNSLIGLWCVDGANTPIVFTSTSDTNHVISGVYGNITIDAGALRNEFVSSRMAGTWIDNGTGTVVNSLFSFGSPSGYIHPTFITSWTNSATSPYETFTSSGFNITRAINTTGEGIAYSNSFKLQQGATYLFQWLIALNSGTLPGFAISTNNSSTAMGVCEVGTNLYMFTAPSSDTYYFVIRTESGVAADFGDFGINVKQIN